jgi:hypothetical protein
MSLFYFSQQSHLANIIVKHFHVDLISKLCTPFFRCRRKVFQARGPLFSSAANLFGQESRQILKGVGNLACKLFCALELNICSGAVAYLP